MTALANPASGAVPGSPWSRSLGRTHDPAPDFSVAIGRTSAMVVVTVRGRLDAGTAPLLDSLLGDLIVGQGNLSLMVDLRHLSAVEPSSLAVIDAAAEVAARHGGALTVAGATAGGEIRA